MPWIPMYATVRDLEVVLAKLNEDEEIAFIVASGMGKWKAMPQLNELNPRTCLWHVPGGSLPLIEKVSTPSMIVDPWRGWKEKVTGVDRSVPYFGAGCPGIIWLNAVPNGQNEGYIGMSSFEWIGNRYRAEGYAAHPCTEKWWRRIGQYIRQVGKKVPRAENMKPEIWALDDAYARIMDGQARETNP